MSAPLSFVEAPSSRIFAGTSGWAYPTWKPVFYPPKLPAKNFLNFYASQLSSVEVNYTFRALPTANQLENWLALAANPGFRFSFKAPQRITHFSRLVDCDAHLDTFLSALAPVAEAGQLGLILFQLPPNLKADLPRLRCFLGSPAFRSASSLPAAPIAFEFRHESWFAAATESLLRDHNAALCIAETDDLTTPELHTASTHTGFRLRRAGGYTPAEVAAFASRFRALSADRDVYVYFRHEDEPTGALNAQALMAALASPESASPAE